MNCLIYLLNNKFGLAVYDFNKWVIIKLILSIIIYYYLDLLLFTFTVLNHLYPVPRTVCLWLSDSTIWRDESLHMSSSEAHEAYRCVT